MNWFTSGILTSGIQSRDLQTAARKLGLQVRLLEASTDGDIDTAFAILVQLQWGGLVINSDSFLERRSERLAAGRIGLPVLTDAVEKGIEKPSER